MAVDSPCVSICKIVEKTGICRGCGRSLAEIKAWRVSSDDEKRAILAAVAARCKRRRPAKPPQDPEI